MKQVLNCYKNWRIWCLTILSVVAFILLNISTESFLVFIGVKLLGFALLYIIYLLYKMWKTNGKIEELTNLDED